jgi:hypothetical protein
MSEPHTLSWVKMLGSNKYDESLGVAIDSNNNVYITGYTDGTLPDGSDNAGIYDAFLAKYDSSGTRQWVKMLGSTEIDIADDVAIDSNNNVYITGRTKGTLPDGSANVNFFFDAYLAKYDSNGTRQWVKMLGSTSADFSYGVAIDSNNNVYITGHTDGTFPDGSANVGNTKDAYLAKYDSNGTRQWVKMLGSTATDESRSVAIDSNNNVYITGFTNGTLPNGTDPVNGTFDAFLAKYDSNGNRQWVKMLGSTAIDVADDVAIDSNNNVYITGQTAGTFPDGSANVNITTYDAYLAKYDSSGNRQWVKMLGSNTDDYSLGVAIDSNNNVYITGYTDGTFPDGSDNVGIGDAFLAKYDSSGNRQWVKMLGSNRDDRSDGVAIDSNNNVYITGYTNGTFPDGSANVNITTYDAYLAKYVPPRITPTLSNFSIPTKIFGDSSFQITPPTSTSVGAFTYVSSNTAVATVSGNTVTIFGVGNSTITATQAATSTYKAGTITATFQVNKRDPTLSNFSIPTKMVDDSSFQIIAPTSTSVGAFTYDSSNTAVATVSGNTVTIRGAGNSTITATQAATSNYNAGTITATFQVNDYPIPENIILDDANTYNVSSGNVQVSIVDNNNMSTNKVSYWYSTTGGVPNTNSGVINNGPSQTNYRFYIPLSSGTYTISVYAKNPSGNSSIVSKNVTVNTTPFAPTIDTGNTKSLTSGNLMVAFTDLSNNANNQVEYTYFLYDPTITDKILYS